MSLDVLIQRGIIEPDPSAVNAIDLGRVNAKQSIGGSYCRKSCPFEMEKSGIPC
jgi:hypothetical protein